MDEIKIMLWDSISHLCLYSDHYRQASLHCTMHYCTYPRSLPSNRVTPHMYPSTPLPVATSTSMSMEKLLRALNLLPLSIPNLKNSQSLGILNRPLESPNTCQQSSQCTVVPPSSLLPPSPPPPPPPPYPLPL